MGQFHYKTQGWGLTHDDHCLIMSDGSSILYYLNPAHFKIVKKLTVKDGANKINRLNALYYRHHLIYANIWHTNIIAVISSKTGHIISWIDATKLTKRQSNMNRECKALNGITGKKDSKSLLVTGKCWPYLYKIRIASKK